MAPRPSYLINISNDSFRNDLINIVMNDNLYLIFDEKWDNYILCLYVNKNVIESDYELGLIGEMLGYCYTGDDWIDEMIPRLPVSFIAFNQHDNVKLYILS